METSRGRFIVLAMRDRSQRYVQCIFIDRDTAMFCEASSGAYATDDQSLFRLVLTQEARDALHRLGFSQNNPKENYSRTLPLGSPPEFAVAADLMLAALFDAYGARRETVIEMNAPHGGNAHRMCGAPGV